MATYIVLGKWTAQGMGAIEDSPKRLDAFKKLLKGRGAQLRAYYMLFGPHDFLCVLEAKDEGKLASALLEAASLGNVTTQTFRAFDEDEYRKIMKSL